MRLAIRTLLLLATCVAPLGAQQVTVTPVAGPVHRIDGAIDNIVVSAGPDGLLMVDTGYDFAADGVRARLRDVAGRAVPDVLIATHHHHTFANHVYAGPGTRVIAQERAARAMGVAGLMAGQALAPWPEAGRPGETFADSMALRFNGERIAVTHVPGAHTGNDAVVWFEGSRVLAAGDVYVPHQPWIDIDAGGTLEGWIEALDWILATFPADTRVVPGHDPVTATMADVRAFREMFVAAADTVRARVARGLGLGAIQALGLTPEIEHWESDALPQELFLESLYRAIVPARTNPAAPSLAFVNGRWLEGGGFEARTMYAVNGVLQDTAPTRVDRVIDLGGGWVVPPFGEAHTHRLSDAARLDDDHAAFLEAGVFYAMVQDPVGDVTPAHRQRARRADAVEVAYTQGVVTPSSGTIARMYGMMADAGRFGAGVGVADLDGRLIFRLDSPADVAARWPAIERLNDRFIKVILAFSDERAARLADPERYPVALPAGTAAPGIATEVLAELVERAHAAGLAVSAHIETAADFRVAVAAGVDWIAHMPASWQVGEVTGYGESERAPWLLAAEDAFAARRARVRVITTLAPWDAADPRRALFDAIHRHNLEVLAQAGTTLAIGSDLGSGTAVDEALHLRTYGALDDAQLLLLLSVQTPRLIFPELRIGHLRQGYEASFLVLGGDPTADLTRIRDIRLRVRNGVVLN